MSEAQDTDLLLVNRNGTSYKQEIDTMRDRIADTDLLLVYRGNKAYKITGEDFIDSTQSYAAPVLTNAVLAEVPPGGTTRFADQDFNVTYNMATDGVPASSKLVKPYVIGGISLFGETSAITNIANIPPWDQSSVWSSNPPYKDNGAADDSSGSSIASIFNGVLPADASECNLPTNGTTYHELDFGNSTFTGSTNLKLWISASGATNPTALLVNGVAVTPLTNSYPAVYTYETTLPNGLQTIEWRWNSVDYCYIGAVEVNGNLLVDTGITHNGETPLSLTLTNNQQLDYFEVGDAVGINGQSGGITGSLPTNAYVGNSGTYANQAAQWGLVLQATPTTISAPTLPWIYFGGGSSNPSTFTFDGNADIIFYCTENNTAGSFTISGDARFENSATTIAVPSGVDGDAIGSVKIVPTQSGGSFVLTADTWVYAFGITGNNVISVTAISPSVPSISVDSGTWAVNDVVTNTVERQEQVNLSTDDITASDDGPWNLVTLPTTQGWFNIAYGNGKYITVGGSGAKRVMYSTDAINWILTDASDNSNNWSGIVYGNSKWVALASTGTNRAMHSTDGIIWTAATNPPPQSKWSDVVYGDSKYVGIALTSGTGTPDQQVMYSADGDTWTAANSTTAIEENNWYSIAYGNGKFVAVSYDGTNRLMYSADGDNWTPVSVPANEWYGVAYGNGKFVAVANTGTNRAMYSTDGISWTNATTVPNPATNQSWQSVAYSDGLFVALSYDGTDKVMYSSDGDTWTMAIAPVHTGYWYKLTGGGGKFVAMTNNYNTSMWSTNGTGSPRLTFATDSQLDHFQAGWEIKQDAPVTPVTSAITNVTTIPPVGVVADIDNTQGSGHLSYSGYPVENVFLNWADMTDGSGNNAPGRGSLASDAQACGNTWTPSTAITGVTKLEVRGYTKPTNTPTANIFYVNGSSVTITLDGTENGWVDVTSALGGSTLTSIGWWWRAVQEFTILSGIRINDEIVLSTSAGEILTCYDDTQLNNFQAGDVVTGYSNSWPVITSASGYVQANSGARTGVGFPEIIGQDIGATFDSTTQYWFYVNGGASITFDYTGIGDVVFYASTNGDVNQGATVSGDTSTTAVTIPKTGVNGGTAGSFTVTTNQASGSFTITPAATTYWFSISAIKVVSVTPASNQMTVDGGTWTNGDTATGPVIDGTGSVISPDPSSKTMTIQQKMYSELLLDSTGAIATDAAKAFDGVATQSNVASGSSPVTWTKSISNVTALRVFAFLGGAYGVKVNGNAVTGLGAGSYQWVDVTSGLQGSTTLESISWTHTTSNTSSYIGAVEVNGVVLTDEPITRFAVGSEVETVNKVPNPDVKLFCVTGTTGSITDLSLTDPGYTTMATDNVLQTLTFPATFPSGVDADTELPVGTTLAVDVKASNMIGTATATTNVVTPTT